MKPGVEPKATAAIALAHTLNAHASGGIPAAVLLTIRGEVLGNGRVDEQEGGRAHGCSRHHTCALCL